MISNMEFVNKSKKNQAYYDNLSTLRSSKS